MVPTLEYWLTASSEEVAFEVASHHLAVLFSIDGTRRHYLLHNELEEITDFAAYTRFTAERHIRVYDMLFSLGVETIMSSFLYPPNFQRSVSYVQQAVASCQQLLTTDAFLALYKHQDVIVRMVGDYDISPNAAVVRSDLMALASELRSVTPRGTRSLRFGFYAGDPITELITRSTTFTRTVGTPPTREELCIACFPEGPSAINILIEAGWLRVGLVLPSILDNGQTDIYNLTHLALEVQEETIRRILYDHLFRRWAAAEDDLTYSAADLAALREYYADHPNGVIGIGQIVGPGLWYAEHP